MKIHWTYQKEEQLARSVATHGRHWNTIIEKDFPGVTPAVLKNKWLKMQLNNTDNMYCLQQQKQCCSTHSVQDDTDDLLEQLRKLLQLTN